ncbi:MAG: OmpH family outer membrane protein [Cyclobacteriaceae bacterium]|nr:OmpH family outer membrane protein [Cyclobacteriaceae bacterium]
MKNLSLVLNAVLLIAVGVLYYIHFAPKSSGESSGSTSFDIGELKVAYINSDSVMEKYDYLKARVEVLEAKRNKIEQDFRNRAESLEKEIQAYQRNVNNMTVGQVRAVEEDLGKKQQNLQLFEQSATQELMNDQSKLNKELYDRITAFLSKYGKEKGLHIVLKWDTTSDVLYGVEALDITPDVVSGLNAEYAAEKNQ